MTGPIKIGFLGGGHRADSLWNSIFTQEEFEDDIHPQAVMDLNAETTHNWRYKVDNQHNDLDSFMKDDIDAVIIGTPPHTHANLALKCLQAGIDVWSEVPMGLTMDEIWQLIDAVKSNKGRKGQFSFGENYCYFVQPQFMAMQHRQNKIGEIYYCEGEYSHSVEHYMIEENFLHNQEIDPETAETVTPTWRATLVPITYGHALGPALYVLNNNADGRIERPVEVMGMGNMKMQKRFKTDNFQIITVKTDHDTIIKVVNGFVLGSHGRIHHSFWGSRGLYMGGSYQSEGTQYYYEVPEDKAAYPDRHNQEAKNLTHEDLAKMGTPTAKGGHGGSDTLMFKVWLDAMVNRKSLEIDVYRGAEMCAPLLLGADAIREHKAIEIPRFE